MQIGKMSIRSWRSAASMLAVAAIPSRAQHPRMHRVPPTLARAEQLVVVTTADWDTTAGSLWRFSRAAHDAAWHLDAPAIQVVVGRTGLAWGVGFDDAGHSGPHKHEGDGKSPAGVFPLDTVFGFAPADSARDVRLPYVQLTAGTDCVDDTASAHYNTVIDRERAAPVDWASAEHMRNVGQYRIGVIVGYNAAPPVAGRGSCIFLHIWNGPGSVTAGCTAFDADALASVIAWLEPRHHPALVQLTAADYTRLRHAWMLPTVPPARHAR
jgi:L,D-peptidoglycan transpeptidase YkuD (ErfK/YbiS/YcfS/YnhG family)